MYIENNSINFNKLEKLREITSIEQIYKEIGKISSKYSINYENTVNSLSISFEFNNEFYKFKLKRELNEIKDIEKETIVGGKSNKQIIKEVSKKNLNDFKENLLDNIINYLKQK